MSECTLAYIVFQILPRIANILLNRNYLKIGPFLKNYLKLGVSISHQKLCFPQKKPKTFKLTKTRRACLTLSFGTVNTFLPPILLLTVNMTVKSNHQLIFRWCTQIRDYHLCSNVCCYPGPIYTCSLMYYCMFFLLI